MANINIESNRFLKEQLGQIGFVKKAEWFVRERGDATQHLGFMHSNHGERQTRYYTCTFGFDYECAKKAAEEMGIILISTGSNSYNFIMERPFFSIKKKLAFREWKIESSYSDEKCQMIVKQIIEELIAYVLPVMEQYIYIDDFLKAMENGTIDSHLLFDRQLPPILYILHGDNEKAEKYIKQMLVYYDDDNRIGKGVEYIETRQYKETRYSIPEKVELRNYLNFIEKYEIWKKRFNIPASEPVPPDL